MDDKEVAVDLSNLDLPAPEAPVVGGFTPAETPSEDVAKAAAAAGTRVFTETLPGLTGSAFGWTSGLRDWLVGEKAAAGYRDTEQEGLTDDQLLDISEGRGTTVNLIPGYNIFLPTISGMAEFSRPRLPYTVYEPTTPHGKIAEAATQLGLETALTGSPKTALARGVTGAVAGGTGRAVGMAAEENLGVNPLLPELGTNIAVSVALSPLTTFFKRVAFANPNAYREIAADIRSEIQKNPEKFRAWADAANSGGQASLVDFVSPELMKKLQKKVPREFLDEIIGLSETTSRRARSIDKDVLDNLDNIFINRHGAIGWNPQSLGQAQWEQVLKDAQQIDVDKAYEAVRKSSASSNVWSPEIKILLSDPKIKKAYDEVIQEVSNDPTVYGDITSNIVLPQTTKKKFVAPNLDFWDVVKRKLDSKAKYEISQGSSPDISAGYKLSSARLREAVDNRVPGYSAARGEAQVRFGTAEALDSGYGVVKALGSSNLKKVDEYILEFDKNLSRLPPAAQVEIRTRLAQGAGRRIYELYQSDNVNALTRIMSGGASKPVIQRLLGKQLYEEVYGQIAKGSILKASDPIVQKVKTAIEQKPSVVSGAPITEETLRKMVLPLLGGSGAGAVAYMGNDVNALATAAIGLGISGFIAAARNTFAKIASSAEKREIQKILTLISSDDPQDIAKLGTLLSTNIRAVTAFKKYTSAMENGFLAGLWTTANSDAYEKAKNEDKFTAPEVNVILDNLGYPEESPKERKHGGRLGGNSISMEMKRAREAIKGKTERILSMPDDAIATALGLANGE